MKGIKLIAESLYIRQDKFACCMSESVTELRDHYLFVINGFGRQGGLTIDANAVTSSFDKKCNIQVGEECD